MRIPWHKRVYALYKGEEYIADGTIRELSRKTGKSVGWLRWMTKPAYQRRVEASKKRLQLVSLDDGKED